MIDPKVSKMHRVENGLKGKENSIVRARLFSILEFKKNYF